MMPLFSSIPIMVKVLPEPEATEHTRHRGGFTSLPISKNTSIVASKGIVQYVCSQVIEHHVLSEHVSDYAWCTSVTPTYLINEVRVFRIG